jgi:hypothetical protein
MKNAKKTTTKKTAKKTDRLTNITIFANANNVCPKNARAKLRKKFAQYANATTARHTLVNIDRATKTPYDFGSLCAMMKLTPDVARANIIAYHEKTKREFITK